ncbi:MAG: CapA family protein [Bacteroidales bacterium]|nr:CapA family protein [Bacteroidales bacterium]
MVRISPFSDTICRGIAFCLRKRFTLERIINNVQRIRNNDSILVLSLHWGSEYSDKAFKWMISSGKKLIEAGVTILYGHHSHTYQGVASYRDGVFAPGLGNFILKTSLLRIEDLLSYKLRS